MAIHVFRLGPFEAAGRDSYAFGGVNESGVLVRPEVARSDNEGLSAIVKRHQPPLRCEPELAAVGKAFGFRARRTP